MAEKIRDPYFDLIKFVAIFMVVLSHVQSYRPGFSFGDMPSLSLIFIMVVNMPLFFMVSGYFAYGLHQSGNWVKLLDRLVSYFWPMAFFAILSALLECFLLNKYPLVTVPVFVAKKFLLQGWFFWALASCEICTFIAYRIGTSNLQRFLIGGLAYIIFVAISGRVPHAYNIVSMIPFYWVGLIFLYPIMMNRRLMVISLVLGGRCFMQLILQAISRRTVFPFIGIGLTCGTS